VIYFIITILFPIVIGVIHSKKCWVVSTQIGSNMDKPKCLVKNAIKNFTVESESWSWVKIWNYIFNPTFGFVHILPKFGFKQPSIV